MIDDIDLYLFQTSAFLLAPKFPATRPFTPLGWVAHCAATRRCPATTSTATSPQPSPPPVTPRGPTTGTPSRRSPSTTTSPAVRPARPSEVTWTAGSPRSSSGAWPWTAYLHLHPPSSTPCPAAITSTATRKAGTTATSAPAPTSIPAWTPPTTAPAPLLPEATAWNWNPFPLKCACPEPATTTRPSFDDPRHLSPSPDKNRSLCSSLWWPRIIITNPRVSDRSSLDDSLISFQMRWGAGLAPIVEVICHL